MHHGRNPLLPLQWHIPDPEVRVFDGEIYIYGSYDTAKDQYCSTEYYVAHSSDFASWSIEGPVFTARNAHWSGHSKARSSLSGVQSYEDLPAHIRQLLPENARHVPVQQIIDAIHENAAKDLPEKTLLYAPDAIVKNGKCYLYMCLSDDSEGVAEADTPTGPFLNARQLPIQGIDPAVFMDDDGTAYYYWGQFRANAAMLAEDMVALRPETIVEGIVTEKTHHFHEGSSMRKRGDIYYFVFADISRGKPTCLGYATATSPLGPFAYQGVIIDNAGCDPKSWNNHGSIEEINGQWYVFYHRSTRNSQSMRRVCAEPIFFDADGLIGEVKMTSQGPGAPYEIDERIPACAACGVFGGAYIEQSDDEFRELVSLPGENCGAIFRYFHARKAVRWAIVNGTGGARVEIWADGVLAGEGMLSGCKIPVRMAKGLHEIHCVFKNTCNAKFHSLMFSE